MEKAQKSMDLLDYDQAIYYYEQALIENPSKPEIRPLLGFCYFRTGKYNDVVRVCLDELAVDRESLHAHILLSYVYYYQGKREDMVAACQDYHTALERYLSSEENKIGKEYKVKRGKRWILDEENSEILRKNILKRYSNLGLPYFILGVHHKKNLNFEQAFHNIRQAMIWEYDPIDCHTQLIDIELYQEHWDLAVEKSKNAMRLLGPQADFYFLMAYAHYQLRQMESAESFFSNAFELKPYVVETFKNLAKVHLAMGNFDKAEVRFKQVMKVSPLDYNVKFLLERSLSKKHVVNPTQRLKLTKILAERPVLKYKYTFETDITFVANLINGAAMTLLKKGLLDEAIVMTESFLEVYEAAPTLNYNLGHFYNMKNHLDKALKYAWRAAELQEDFKDAYDLIGNIFFKVGDFESSIKSYQKVIAIDPKDAMSFYNLGCVLSAKGEAKGAEESWLSAIRYEKNKRIKNEDEISKDELNISLVVVGRQVVFKSHTALGHLYTNQKLWDKALEQFQSALELEPNRSELHYEIGKIHIERANIPEAKRHLEKYLYFGGAKEEEVKQLLDTLKERQHPQTERFDNWSQVELT
ncbi:MAG: tetratricopeptide repeat protein [Candidatus Aminicenantes bacterium]